MDTENQQQEQVSLDPQILLEVQAEQIKVLTDQNIQLGAYIRQLKRDFENAQETHPEQESEAP